MKWITREHVKVDRVACPWLIKKFVDKDAEFFFVPGDKVMDEAKRLDATPYDVKNVELGHHGKECSFEAILKKYGLGGDRALVRGESPHAEIVIEARERGCDLVVMASHGRKGDDAVILASERALENWRRA